MLHTTNVVANADVERKTIFAGEPCKEWRLLSSRVQ